MANRFAIYIYSLIYPAVLGTFLFGLIQAGLPRTAEHFAMLLMAVFFVTQYGEGAIAAQEKGGDPPRAAYTNADLLFDCAEILLMILTFAALGAFDGAGAGGAALSDRAQLPFLPIDPERDQWLLMALVFVLPVLERGGRRIFQWSASAKRGNDPEHAVPLSVLSGLAALAALTGLLCPIAANIGILVVLGIYCWKYVIKWT